MSISLATTINPTYASAAQATLTSVLAQLATETHYTSRTFLQLDLFRVEQTLAILSNEQVIATATDSQVVANATEAIFWAADNLKSVEFTLNLYGSYLSLAGNLAFCVIMGLLFLVHAGILIYSRYWYFGVAFFCGAALEFLGYLGRSLSHNNYWNFNDFLLQIICLTIAPAFLMGGIYFLLAQLCVIYGASYSILKPMWYSYIFIFCDVLSLVIQAVGGGMAGIALNNSSSTDPGTHTMVAGISFQVFSMTLFFFFWFDFLNRIYFKVDPNFRFSFKNFAMVFFNIGDSKESEILESYYTPEYKDIRKRKLFKWFPLMVTLSVIFIYIRCIYRVIELAQGWSGFLITHENYIFCLDALMVALSLVLYVPFHPCFVFGKDAHLSFKGVRAQAKEQRRGNEDVDMPDLEDKGNEDGSEDRVNEDGSEGRVNEDVPEDKSPFV